MKAYLQRINPDKKTVWFYSIQIQQDLWGHWQVIREWGRYGSPGTMRTKEYERVEEAMDALEQTRDQLVNKGYRLMVWEGTRSTESM